MHQVPKFTLAYRIKLKPTCLRPAHPPIYGQVTMTHQVTITKKFHDIYIITSPSVSQDVLKIRRV